MRVPALLVGISLLLPPAFQATSTLRSELAPSGTMRVAVNLGNQLLVANDPGGQPRGIAVDLARELARRANLPVEIVTYVSAGKIAAVATTGAWDVAFVGAEPERAADITFSPAYLEIEAGYLVPAGSPLQSSDDVDRDGIDIAVTEKSAYDLYLSRNLKRARLVRATDFDHAYKRFVDEKLTALAGLKPVLLETSKGLPGSRVLPGHFSVVKQAIGIPKGRDAGARFLSEFSEEIRRSGLVAQLTEKHGIRGVSVPPWNGERR